jgi:urease accessory protein
MGWHGRLDLRYRRDGDRCIAHDRHEGPLRVLAALHPEGGAVCHHVLVHPPGGIVGGDTLGIDIELGPGAHALLTTPGATRYYRAERAAEQHVLARAADGARLEWLPLETIVHAGAQGEIAMRFELADGAEMIGLDVLALGLPGAGQPFEGRPGRYLQRIELPGIWLERGAIDAADLRLLDSPLGWAGHRVLATAWFGAGSALDTARRERLLDAARGVADAHPLAATASATSPDARVIVLRALAPRVEPAMALLHAVWAAWRDAAWSLPACAPRVWRT